MMQLSSAWRRRVGAVLVAAAMAACGGGGGGGDTGAQPAPGPSGPPTTAATLADTSSDAVSVTQAAVSAADGLVSQQGALNGLGALFPVGATGSSPSSGVAFVGHPRRMRAQAVTNLTCTELFEVSCTGTATLDTNIADNATTVTAGQYIDVTFSGVSFAMAGEQLGFNGGLRIDFLTGFNGSSVANLSLRISTRALTVTADGVSFGPSSETLDLSFDSAGVPSLITDGARYGSAAGVSVSGQGDYTISSGTARLGYGSAATGYVDVNLSHWNSSGNRPALGSTATVTAPGWEATITVVSSSSTTVAYDVAIRNTATNATGGYRVTATYPGGSAAPSYSAVAS